MHSLPVKHQFNLNQYGLIQTEIMHQLKLLRMKLSFAVLFLVNSDIRYITFGLVVSKFDI